MHLFSEQLHPEGEYTKAYSKWFPLNGKWEWKPCLVVGYDDKEMKYLIQWDNNQKQKHVSRCVNGSLKVTFRLNLRFEAEDESSFQARLQTAMDNRLLSETHLVSSYKLAY